MATTPTQMRLTAEDLKKVDKIAKHNGGISRTEAVRIAADAYIGLLENEKKKKKSSVAT